MSLTPTPPTSTSHVRPPQVQPRPVNYETHFGSSHCSSANPGTVATFHPHGHTSPPLPLSTAGQIPTTLTSHPHQPLFQHQTTAYGAPRAPTTHQHARYPIPLHQPYVPSNLPRHPFSGDYSSLSSAYSSQAVHGSLASSTPSSSSSSVGFSPYPPYHNPAGAFYSQQPTHSLTAGEVECVSCDDHYHSNSHFRKMQASPY